MSTVSLDDKLWGWKAKYHFYTFTALFVALSLISTLAFIDYARMPSDKVTGDFRRVFWHEYMYVIPARMSLGVAFLSLIICPNQIWYGFCSVALLAYVVTTVAFTMLLFLYHGSWDGRSDDVKKYFPCGIVSDVIYGMTSRALLVYLGAVLFKLSFLYTPEPEEDDCLIIVSTPPPTIISYDKNGNPKVSPPSRLQKPKKFLEFEEISESDREVECENRSPTGRMIRHTKARRSEGSSKSSRRSKKSVSKNLDAEKSGKSTSSSSKGSHKSKKSKKSQKSEKSYSNSLEEKPMIVGL